MIYGQVEWNEAVLAIGIFRSGSEDGGLFLKALPVPEREAEVLSFRLRTGLSERGIHLLRRGGGEGERGVRGQDYLRLGHAEAAQLLDTVRLPERDGVHAGVERFPGAFHAAGPGHGADAAAVHHDLAAEALGRAQGEEVVPEAPAAGDVLDETAAAVHIQRGPAHSVHKAGKVEGVDGGAVHPRGGAGGVSAHDGDGHEPVHGAQLGHDGVQDGLVPGVAHAVGAADDYAGAALLFAPEDLFIDLTLLAAGGLHGKTLRGPAAHGVAQPLPERGVRGQLREPGGQGLVVSGAEEVAGLAVLYELWYPADGGSHGGQTEGGALRQRVGEGLREGTERVYVEGGVELLHIIQPAGEADGVTRAELFGQAQKVGALRTLARDDELELRVLPPGKCKASHERGQVLHGVQPCGRAYHDVARADLCADPLAEGGPVQALGLAGEVQAVVDCKGGLTREAAGDEQLTHGVRDADVVFDPPQGQDVQHAVGGPGEGAAHIVQPVVAVHGADDRPAAARAQDGPG